MKKGLIYKVIRIVTVAPVMAFAALSVLFVCDGSVFRGTADYITAVLLLVAVPLLAYPLQPIIPGFKDKGRDGQRRLAIVMAVVGYIFGILAAFITHASKGLKLIYMVYFISGVMILLFNKVLKIKASGHACGVAGPLAYLAYFLGAYALIGLPVMALVYLASLKMKRHKLSELLTGSVIPCAALGISLIIL